MDKSLYLPRLLREESDVTSIASIMLKDRIIFINGEINNVTAVDTVAQLLYLEAQDPTKDINVYINSPGGNVTDGLAIYDTMQFVRCDVSTICIGMAASMGALLLCAGTKGKRYALPHSEIMIHQPLGGTGYTQASNVEIIAKHIMKTKRLINKILADITGKSIEQIEKDTDRDYYMSAKEALDYGLIDKIFEKRE
ncbi:MAG: ATP-dependent Clp protease proteolytic subunit [Christensenellales bacterium]|jgi:ATP-dependent Clp protease protease subunit|nr:ATP-dependent Clp protease proteolytic subunit [Eubacteriales bacterium]